MSRPRTETWMDAWNGEGKHDRLEQHLLGTAFAMVEVLRSLVEYMALGVPREQMPEAERTMLDDVLSGDG